MMIPDHDIRRAPCPKCLGEKFVSVLSEFKDDWEDLGGRIYGTERYFILQCKGCEQVFFGRGSVFSEDEEHEYNDELGHWYIVRPERMTYYPRHSGRRRPSWLDQLLGNDLGKINDMLKEVYTAYDSGTNVLAAIGVRLVFDLISQRLGAESSHSFENKIEYLRAKQYITGRERDDITTLVEAGNAAAHQSWEPKAEEIETMLDLLESTVVRNFIIPRKTEMLRKSVPPRSGGV